MMSTMTVRVGGKTIQEGCVQSKWSGDLEETRRTLVHKISEFLVPTAIMTKLTLAASGSVLAAGNAVQSADKIRMGFEQLLDVFTAITEPILWFYALTACIMMATKNKEAGWNRLKQVGYGYAGIALLPTFFAFLRYVANLIKDAVQL